MDPEAAIDYPKRIEQALLGMVRSLLREAAEDGLPGEHHFYITFATDFEGVEIPAFLLKRYPKELTIILQHQFWELDVEENHFSVVLSFDRARHRVIVPFAALRAFVDPAAHFGLRFGVQKDEETQAEEESEAKPTDLGQPGNVVSFDRFKKGE